MNLFKKKDEKVLYLAGWEVDFDGSDECQRFIQTQAIDKETAFTISSSLELVFRDNILFKAYEIDEGRRTVKELEDEEKKFKYPDVKINEIFKFVPVEDSDSYLGGEPPSNFAIPKFEFNAPFQYLGKFSKKDEAFNWLPFDFHLVAPIYLNFFGLLLDYTDPDNPIVLNLEDLEKADTSYECLQPDSEVVFQKYPFLTKKSNDYGYDLGHSGVPNWGQFPIIPICPKTNRTMRFLCQLKSDAEVMTARTNVKPDDECYYQYFEEMNFWGNGDLFVFFEPESKVACVFIQNT